MNGDELDAVTAALVGQLFLHGKAEVLGNFKRGAIVIPYPKETRKLLSVNGHRANTRIAQQFRCIDFT